MRYSEALLHDVGKLINILISSIPQIGLDQQVLHSLPLLIAVDALQRPKYYSGRSFLNLSNFKNANSPKMQQPEVGFSDFCVTKQEGKENLYIEAIPKGGVRMAVFFGGILYAKINFRS
jgi:hypothetical protein